MINRDYGHYVDGEWSQGTFNDSVRLFDFASGTSHLLFEENSPQGSAPTSSRCPTRP
ncbi:hypothetical protein [Micromonospora sp. NPDC005299]|uniref:hypothetical protein n=1 Tax=Micromonospora sp. NPDC005299 TaxID=3364231 RepID=UPI003696DB3C